MITANNVFAHADDLAGITEGIRALLAPNGVFVFEGSYLVDVFEKVEQLVAVHKTRPILENMLDLLLGYYRDLFLLIETGNGDAIQHVEKTDWLNRTAQKLSFDKVQSAISAIEEIKKNILQNAQVQLAMTVLALRLRAVGTVAKQVTTPGSTS